MPVTSAKFPDVNTKLGRFAFVPQVCPGLPNYKFAATGGSGTTATVDTSGSGAGPHDATIDGAADDFFNALQLVWDTNTTTAALRDQVYDISDFAVVASVATFTVSTAMAATPASGDTFRVYGLIQVTEDPTTETNTEMLERNILKQTYDPATSLRGLERNSGSIEVHFPSVVTPSGDGTAAGYDRYSALMSIFGSRTAIVGTSVDPGNTGDTTIDVADSSPFDITAGIESEVMIDGQVRKVVGKTTGAPDTITLHRALSAPATPSAIVYSPERWTPFDGGETLMTLLRLEDDILWEMNDAVFNLKYGAEFAQIAFLTLDWQGGNWTLTPTGASPIATGETLPGSVPDKLPCVFKVSAACELESLELDINSFEFDEAADIQELLAIRSNLLPRKRGRRSVIQVVWRTIDNVPKNVWEAAVTKQYIMIACGNTAGGTILISGTVDLAESIANAEVGATHFWDASFGFVDDGDKAVSFKPILSRF